MIYVLFGLSGVFLAFKELLLFKYHSSFFAGLNPNFWDPSISWRNKYKKRVPPKELFLGSTTVFVMFTDGFHLCKWLSNFFLFLGLGLTIGFVPAGIVYFVRSTCFELVFRTAR